MDYLARKSGERETALVVWVDIDFHWNRTAMLLFFLMSISTNLQWSTFYFRYIYYIRLAKFADLQQGIINREKNKQTNKETNKAQRETNLFSSRIMYLLLSP